MFDVSLTDDELRDIMVAIHIATTQFPHLDIRGSLRHFSEQGADHLYMVEFNDFSKGE